MPNKILHPSCKNSGIINPRHESDWIQIEKASIADVNKVTCLQFFEPRLANCCCFRYWSDCDFLHCKNERLRGLLLLSVRAAIRRMRLRTAEKAAVWVKTCGPVGFPLDVLQIFLVVVVRRRFMQRYMILIARFHVSHGILVVLRFRQSRVLPVQGVIAPVMNGIPFWTFEQLVVHSQVFRESNLVLLCHNSCSLATLLCDNEPHDTIIASLEKYKTGNYGNI